MSDIQPWAPALQKIAALAAKDRSPQVRMTLLHAYHAQGRDGETMAFLDDVDEEIRSQTIRWVARRPNGTSLLREYVAKHRTYSERSKSVGLARKILDFRAKQPAPEKGP